MVRAKMGPPGEVEIARAHRRQPARVDQRGDGPVDHFHCPGGPDKGDVEEEDQDGDAAHEFGVKDGSLAQKIEARGAGQGNQKPENAGEEKGYESDPDGGDDATG